jgi:hypothetical protein
MYLLHSTLFSRVRVAAGAVSKAILDVTRGVDVDVRCLAMGQDDAFALGAMLADPFFCDRR